MKNSVLITALVMSFTSIALAKKKSACYSVEGMTCTTCSLTIKVAVKKIDGVANVEASYGSKNALVEFDPNKTNDDAIKQAIDSVGYKATKTKCEKGKG